MNDELLEAFLAGRTDEREGQICEDFLTDPKTVINCDETAIDDSLLNALRGNQDFDLADEEQMRLLAQRIERLVPAKAFRIEELSHFFDQPVVPTDLGRIGKYRIVEFIAAGGSSFVFRAIDTESDESRCLKLLRPDSQFNKESVARFEQESIEAAKLDHERIIQVLDHGNQNGLPWLAMPMLPGCSLRQWLDKNETVELNLALHITRQIAEGLKFAHQRSIVHRDIKPDNLWIDENNNIKILDFGLAKMHDGSPPITHQGTVVGTPSYMSPEQVKGNVCDPRSDLFSLGVVLLEMLCGRSPFKKSNLFSTLISVAGEQLEVSKFDKDSKIPPGVRQLISELVQIDPENRIRAAEQVIRRVDTLIADPQRTIDLPKSQSRKNSKKVNWIRAAAAIIVAGLIFSAGFAVWNATDKGTLVVETDHPEVVVQIAKQAVSVHDPVSGKNFRIKIGETPLASGVYHLELQDSANGLTFSSDKIAIRRGEKTIVRVSLVPPPELAKTAQEELAQNKADGFDIPLQDWVDQSLAPTVGDDFSNILPTISPIAPIHGDQDRFSYYANVVKPVSLKTIDSWSIELGNDPLRRPPKIRSNGSMQCTLNKTVRVLEDNQLKYILPIRGRPIRATFDKSYPQLLAVCANVSNTGLDDKSKLPCETTIWRLGNESAELIYRLATDSQCIHWDQGYRLFFDQHRQLSVLRLDTGKIHRLGKTSFDSDTATLGKYATRCFSPNQRFLARYAKHKDKSYVKIWDLARGRTSSSIPIKNFWSAEIYWHNNSQQIAISDRSNNNKRSDYFRIWKTDESIQLKIVNKNEDKRLAQFRQIPKISTGRTRRSKTVRKDLNEFAKTMAYSSLTDKEIQREIKTYLSTSPGLANGDGEDERLKITIEKLIHFRKDRLINRNKLLKIQRIYCSETDHLTIISKPQSPWDGQLSATNLNLKTGNVDWAKVIDPSVSWGRTYLINGSLAHSSLPNLSIKDRRFLLADRIIENNSKNRKANSRNTDYYKSISDLRKGIYDIKNGEWIFDFGKQKNNQRHLSVWSSDGRFAAVGGVARTRRQQDQTLMIYDTQKNKTLNCHELGLPIKPVLQIQPFRAGFLVFLKRDDTQTASSGWLIDPDKKTAVKTALFDEFSTASILSVDANIVWFRGRKPTDNWDDQSVERQSVHYYMAKIVDDTLDILHHETGRERDGYQFSHDGRVAASWKIDGTFSHRGRRSLTLTYESLIGGELKFYSWNPDRTSQPVKLLKTIVGRPASPFLWHPHFESAAWSTAISIGDSSLRLLKRDSLTVKKHLLKHIGSSFFGGDQQFQASRFGWVGAIDNQIVALDPEGQFLGRVLFEPQTDNGIARKPSWILADGSMLSNAPTDNMVIAFVKNKRVYCQPLDEFSSNINNPNLPKFDRLPMFEK